MEDKDEMMLQAYFEANRQHIADDGFSRKVMRRLPDHAAIYNKIWTAVCAVAAIAILAASHSLSSFAKGVMVLLHTVPADMEMPTRPLTIFLGLSILVVVGLCSIIERLRMD